MFVKTNPVLDSVQLTNPTTDAFVMISLFNGLQVRKFHLSANNMFDQEPRHMENFIQTPVRVSVLIVFATVVVWLRWGGGFFWAEFACSPHAGVGFLQVHWFPSTIQRHAN